MLSSYYETLNENFSNEEHNSKIWNEENEIVQRLPPMKYSNLPCCIYFSKVFASLCMYIYKINFSLVLFWYKKYCLRCARYYYTFLTPFGKINCKHPTWFVLCNTFMYKQHYQFAGKHNLLTCSNSFFPCSHYLSCICWEIRTIVINV